MKVGFKKQIKNSYWLSWQWILHLQYWFFLSLFLNYEYSLLPPAGTEAHFLFGVRHSWCISDEGQLLHLRSVSHTSDLYIDPPLPDSWGCSLTARIPQGPNISQHLIGSDLDDFFLAERITNHLYPNIIELICYDFMVHIKLCQGTEAQGAVA